MEASFNLVHLSWALFLGGLSAVSLPLGSLAGISLKPKPLVSSFLAAFGAGALIAALSIELVAPTVSELVNAGSNQRSSALVDFGSLVLGLTIGSILFVILDQLVNEHGGFLRKSATAISYFTQRRKTRAKTMLHELGTIELLRNIPEKHIEDLVRFVRPVIFEKDEVFFDEGDHGDRLFFVQSGTVEIVRGGEHFKDLTGGDVVGEISLVTGAPRTARAIARSRVRALMLLKEDFDRLRRESPELDEASKKISSQRIDELLTRDKDRFRETIEWAEKAVKALQHGSTVPTSIEMKKMSAEHSGAPLAIWLGLLLDGIPESLVIGSGFLALVSAKMAASGGAGVPLTEVIPYTLIAGLFLSNFPEAMSSSAVMRSQGMKVSRILLMWFSLLVLTSVGAGIGYVIGGYLPHSTVIVVEGIAAGAMLTMIAAAMLPEAIHLGGHNIVGVSTLLGFVSAITFKVFE